jgi:predicted DNA binding protein
MIPIVDITVPAKAFELGRLLEELPGIRIELERIVPLEDSIIPLFWVSNTGGEEELVESILLDSELTEDVNYLTEDGKRQLYEVRWSREVDGLVTALMATRAKILEAESIGEGWDFRLQFPAHDDLSEFRELCEEEEIPIILRRLYNPHYPREDNSMTANQQEAILLAYERGYFEVPRKTTISDLAETFDISDNAYSQRLRRGLSSLVFETMVNH